MKKDPDICRLFLGYEVIAAWPSDYPSGRLVPETSRHMTVAFFGSTSLSKLMSELRDISPPPFGVGRSGYFDRCLFLPPRQPRVVAWHACFSDDEAVASYACTVVDWLRAHGYELDRRDFLPHVTVARAPFVVGHWKKSFCVLPMRLGNLNLYESVGNLTYEVRWSYPLAAAFEEISHTADRAFCVRGDDLTQLHHNAQVALAFVFPTLIKYFSHQRSFQNLDDIIVDLNYVLSRADKDEGCPIKAVSYHGEVKEVRPRILEWEMILDV